MCLSASQRARPLISPCLASSGAEFVQPGDDGAYRRAVLEAVLEQFGFDDALRIKNEDDRPRNSMGAIARRVLWVAQIITIDDFGFRIRQQRIRQVTFGGERLQDLGAVI